MGRRVDESDARFKSNAEFKGDARFESPADVTACSAEGECLTCGDVALPLTVVSVTGSDARCRDAAGREETVALDFVGRVGVGDRVLVHAGVAIEVLPTVPTES